MEQSIINDSISREQTQFFKTSKGSSQFLGLVERCGLYRLVEQTLEKRTDSLQSKIKNLPQEALAGFLKTTDDITGESHFINAIHLGLLKEVGQRLGGDALTELLCPDDDTADVYASILADYADDEARLEGWLSDLNEPQKTALRGKIKASTTAYSFSAEDKLKMFLRSIENPASSVKALMIGLDKHKSSPDFQLFLEGWIAKNEKDTQALLIQQKCAELGFIPESATAAAASAASVNEVTPGNPASPSVAYEDLPTDPSGLQLTEMLATLARMPNPLDNSQPTPSPISGQSMRDTIRDLRDGDDEPMTGPSPYS